MPKNFPLPNGPLLPPYAPPLFPFIYRPPMYFPKKNYPKFDGPKQTDIIKPAFTMKGGSEKMKEKKTSEEKEKGKKNINDIVVFRRMEDVPPAAEAFLTVHAVSQVISLNKYFYFFL